MLIRDIRPEEKKLFNQAVDHPLQSWEWGEFRKKTGVKIERLGFFEGEKLKQGLQVSFHSLPLIKNKTIGYFPRGFLPDEDQLSALKQLAVKQQAVFIKLEPNIATPVDSPAHYERVIKFLEKNHLNPGRPLFTKHTFQLDLTKSENELFANLNSKTRYNVNLAFKKGVKIFENTSKEGMEQYLDILQETTRRQGFYAHTPAYFRQMWQSLGDSGMIKIFNAVYQNKILVCWIMFVFNEVLYYPYGASRNLHRNVMASNLMMWEMIRFGKKIGCQTLDMWGSLGPHPDQKNPWYGFHRFKKGYGGQLMEFIGTYDLIINQPFYKIYRIVENLRWKWLKLKTHLPF